MYKFIAVLIQYMYVTSAFMLGNFYIIILQVGVVSIFIEAISISIKHAGSFNVKGIACVTKNGNPISSCYKYQLPCLL